MTKRFRLFALLMAIFMIAAACGSDDASDSTDEGESTDDSSESGDSEEGTTDGDSDGDDSEQVSQTQAGDLTFYMITHSDEGPFWSVSSVAPKQRPPTSVSSWSGRVRTTIPPSRPPTSTPQLPPVPTASPLRCPAPTSSSPGLQAAVAAGIPVYTLNSGVNDYQSIGATTHVGQTEIIAGKAPAPVQRRWCDQGALRHPGAGQRRAHRALRRPGRTFSGEVVASSWTSTPTRRLRKRPSTPPVGRPRHRRLPRRRTGHRHVRPSGLRGPRT